MAALVVAGGATRAGAAEPDVSAPSVCAPPCPEGELCVGNRCVRPTEQSPATSPLPRDRPPPSPPPPPPGSAPTSGPQPGGLSDADRRSPPGDATPPPAPPRLVHDVPPETTYRPTAYPPQPKPRLKRTFLALPFFGFHSYQHTEANGYAPGVRVGALLGGRLNDVFSLNSWLSADFSNLRTPVEPFHERAIHAAFNPMIELPAGRLELIFGAKLGVYLLHSERPAPGFLVGDATAVSVSDMNGLIAGLEAGVFVPVTAHTSVGLLLSFDLIGVNRGCLLAANGGSECGPPLAQNPRVLGITGGVLF